MPKSPDGNAFGRSHKDCNIPENRSNVKVCKVTSVCALLDFDWVADQDSDTINTNGPNPDLS